jgi:hypothetical protein
MVTQVRNETPVSAHPTIANVQARINSDREREPRVIALAVVGSDLRRLILHLLIVAIVVAVAVVGAFAN